MTFAPLSGGHSAAAFCWRHGGLGRWCEQANCTPAASPEVGSARAPSSSTAASRRANRGCSATRAGERPLGLRERPTGGGGGRRRAHLLDVGHGEPGQRDRHPAALISTSVVWRLELARHGAGERHADGHQPERDREVVRVTRHRVRRDLLRMLVSRAKAASMAIPASSITAAIPAVPMPLPMIAACVHADQRDRRHEHRPGQRQPQRDQVAGHRADAEARDDRRRPARRAGKLLLGERRGRARRRRAVRTRGRRPSRRGPSSSHGRTRTSRQPARSRATNGSSSSSTVRPSGCGRSAISTRR